jgi:hypothetical protein
LARRLQRLPSSLTDSRDAQQPNVPAPAPHQEMPDSRNQPVTVHDALLESSNAQLSQHTMRVTSGQALGCSCKQTAHGRVTGYPLTALRSKNGASQHLHDISRVHQQHGPPALLRPGASCMIIMVQCTCTMQQSLYNRNTTRARPKWHRTIS